MSMKLMSALSLGAIIPSALACDCSWTSSCGPRGCGDCKNDGSMCFQQCCGGPPTPTPPPSPTPPPAPGSEWCPSAEDLTVAYGSPQLLDQGWTVSGDGGVATKSAFNLLGGYVEFDIDFSGVQTGVNANIYTISPSIGAQGYDQGNYCDGAGVKPWCMEVDWIESNGNCGGATTLHTKAGPGNDGCTAWGCRASYHYNGRASFHMRIEHGQDGSWTTIRDGQVINAGSMSPSPGGDAWSVVKSVYESKGAVIYSSEWQGWVPVEDCGGGGNLGASHFSVKNLKIKGSVVQGPTPRACNTPTPTPGPTPAPTPGPSPKPTPAPTPTPGPSGCPGGSLAACIDVCPSEAKVYKACVTECVKRCNSEHVVV